jgi:hypothetical protein
VHAVRAPGERAQEATVSACAKCGHDPDAAIAGRWEFAISKELASLNRSAKNGRVAGARAVFRRELGQWQSWMRVARMNNGITPPRGKRRVTITRLIGYRQREFDRDNLVGGGKAIVDAMVREGLLLGDDPTRSEVHYEQVRRDGALGIRVLLEEFA